MNIVNMIARDLPDAWFQTVFKILDEGSVFKIDKNITEYLFRFMFRGKLNYVPYISKKIGLRETNPLLLRIKKYYNWSDKELNNQKKYFMLLFQDEERLKEYENFFGQF